MESVAKSTEIAYTDCTKSVPDSTFTEVTLPLGSCAFSVGVQVPIPAPHEDFSVALTYAIYKSSFFIFYDNSISIIVLSTFAYRSSSKCEKNGSNITS